jgi:hypothetical protein
MDQAGGHRRERHAWSSMAHPGPLPFTGRPSPHHRPRSVPTMAVGPPAFSFAALNAPNEGVAAADAAHDRGLVPDAWPGPADGRKAAAGSVVDVDNLDARIPSQAGPRYRRGPARPRPPVIVEPVEPVDPRASAPAPYSPAGPTPGPSATGSWGGLRRGWTRIRQRRASRAHINAHPREVQPGRRCHSSLALQGRRRRNDIPLPRCQS